MKAPRHSSNRDEICYPFIYETSRLCDYEILTDDLCRQVGGILSLLPEKLEDLRPELELLQPMLYHLNGSVRGRCAVSEEDHQWLLGRYRVHKEATADCLDGFVLPRGPVPVPQLNRASSDAKRVLRLLLRLQVEESIEIPEPLFRFGNLLCNYFFVLTLVVNQAHGFEEVPFVSRSYGRLPAD